MPVDSKHIEWTANKHIWQRIRDFVAGEDAVKKQCQIDHSPYSLTSYLPKPPGQSEADYQIYLTDAEFYGAAGRTVEGLTGAVCAKDPEIQLTGALEAYEENCDRRMTPLMVFAKDVLREVITIGRCGVLVDLPMTASVTAVPYLCKYKCEDIINWRVSVTEDETPKLSRVVLMESFVEPNPHDEFEDVTRTRYRVLELVENVYQIRTYRNVVSADGNEVMSQPVMEMDPIVPRKRSAPLDFIPFVIIGSVSLDPMVQKSPILDLVNVNLHHFRLSAKLNRALFIVSVPQPVVIGDVSQIPGQQQPYRIGGSEAWTLPMGADVKYLEHGGQGIGSIESNIARDEARMVLLGARLLEPQKREAETAEALRLRQAGESATLSTIANTVTWGITTTLQWAAEWVMLNKDDNYLTLNQQFTDLSMSEEDANKLVDRWQKGGASEDDMFYLLKQGGRIEPEIELEEWKRKRLEQAPVPPPMPEFGNGRDTAPPPFEEMEKPA